MTAWMLTTKGRIMFVRTREAAVRARRTKLPGARVTEIELVRPVKFGKIYGSGEVR